jgi:hypothetical protein
LNHKIFLILFLLTSLLIHGKAVQGADNNDPQCPAIAWRTFSCIPLEVYALTADYLPGHEAIVFIDNFADKARPHVQSLDFTEEPERVLGLSDAILAGFTGLKVFRYLNSASNNFLSLPPAVTDFAFQSMIGMTHLHIVGDQFTDAALIRMQHLTSFTTNKEELAGEELTELLRLIRDRAKDESH